MEHPCSSVLSVGATICSLILILPQMPRIIRFIYPTSVLIRAICGSHHLQLDIDSPADATDYQILSFGLRIFLISLKLHRYRRLWRLAVATQPTIAEQPVSAVSRGDTYLSETHCKLRRSAAVGQASPHPLLVPQSGTDYNPQHHSGCVSPPSGNDRGGVSYCTHSCAASQLAVGFMIQVPLRGTRSSYSICFLSWVRGYGETPQPPMLAFSAVLRTLHPCDLRNPSSPPAHPHPCASAISVGETICSLILFSHRCHGLSDFFFWITDFFDFTEAAPLQEAMASRRSHAAYHSITASLRRVPRGHVSFRNPLQAPKERSCGIGITSPSLGSAKRDRL